MIRKQDFIIVNIILILISAQNWDENLEFCDICLENCTYEQDQLIFCESCNALTHQSCYGSDLYKIIPDGQWFCQRCQKVYEYNVDYNVKCFFCCEIKGILKYFNIKGIKIWAHIYCIAWIDMFSFKDGQREEVIMKDRCFKQQKFGHNLCKICNNQVRYYGQDKCYYDKCDYKFHFTCARKFGIIRPLNDLIKCQITDMDKGISIIPLYCPYHIKEMAKQNEFYQEQLENANLFSENFLCQSGISTIINDENNNIEDLQKINEENQEIKEEIISLKKKPGRPRKLNKIVLSQDIFAEQKSDHQQQNSIDLNIQPEEEELEKEILYQNFSKKNNQMYKLTDDIIDIIGYKQQANEKEIKQYIKKYFTSINCVDKTAKMLKIDQDLHPQLYNLFKIKNLDTEIPTGKFYKQFRKLFIEEYEIDEKAIDEMTDYVQQVLQQEQQEI